MRGCWRKNRFVKIKEMIRITYSWEDVHAQSIDSMSRCEWCCQTASLLSLLVFMSLYLILVNQTDLFFVTDPLCSRWRRRRRKDEQCWITITFVRIIIIRSLLIACLTCSIIDRFSSPSFYTRLQEWKAHCYCLFCQLHLSFSLLMYVCISLSLCFRLR